MSSAASDATLPIRERIAVASSIVATAMSLLFLVLAARAQQRESAPMSLSHPAAVQSTR